MLSNRKSLKIGLKGFFNSNEEKEDLNREIESALEEWARDREGLEFGG